MSESLVHDCMVSCAILLSLTDRVSSCVGPHIFFFFPMITLNKVIIYVTMELLSPGVVFEHYTRDSATTRTTRLRFLGHFYLDHKQAKKHVVDVRCAASCALFIVQERIHKLIQLTRQ